MGGLLLACSVCGAGQEGTETSYIVMTIIVSLLPLAMIGGVVFWLWRAVKQRDAAAEAARPLGDAHKAGETQPS